MSEVLIATVILAVMLCLAWGNRRVSRPARPTQEPAPARSARSPRRERRRGFLEGIYVPEDGRLERAKAAAEAGDFAFVQRAVLSTLIDIKHLELDDARERYYARRAASRDSASPSGPRDP